MSAIARWLTMQAIASKLDILCYDSIYLAIDSDSEESSASSSEEEFGKTES